MKRIIFFSFIVSWEVSVFHKIFASLLSLHIFKIFFPPFYCFFFNFILLIAYLTFYLVIGTLIFNAIDHFFPLFSCSKSIHIHGYVSECINATYKRTYVRFHLIVSVHILLQRIKGVSRKEVRINDRVTDSKKKKQQLIIEFNS